MNAWWESLTWLERMFAYVAFPATLLLILQTLMLLFGLGHDADADADADVDGDFDAGLDLDGDGIPDGVDLDGDGLADGAVWGAELDTDAGADGPDADGDGATDGDHDAGGPFGGLKLFTLRGIVAFLAVCGWGGLWLLHMGLHPVLAVFLGIAMGFWAMLLMALFLRVALKLQDDGTMDHRNALGKAGAVYLTIPAGRTGAGKVHVMFQEQLHELDAVTDDPAPIPTGTEVVVIGLSGENTLVVCRK